MLEGTLAPQGHRSGVLGGTVGGFWGTWGASAIGHISLQLLHYTHVTSGSVTRGYRVRQNS